MLNFCAQEGQTLAAQPVSSLGHHNEQSKRMALHTWDHRKEWLGV